MNPGATPSQTWFELLSSEGMDWYALVTNQPLPSQNNTGVITVDPAAGRVAIGGGAMVLLLVVAAFFLLKD